MDVHFVESHRLKAIFEDVRALKGKLEKVLSSDMRTLKTEVENAMQTMNTWETNQPIGNQLALFSHYSPVSHVFFQAAYLS